MKSGQATVISRIAALLDALDQFRIFAAAFFDERMGSGVVFTAAERTA